MDDALLTYISRRFDLQQLLKDPHALMRLRTELERGKIALSTVEETEIAFVSREGQVKLGLKRAELEEAVRPTVERCRGPIRVALDEAGLIPDDIAHVLLVGGPTMMPIVQRTIAEEFQQNARITEELGQLGTTGFPVHPMEAVAQGAVLGVVGKVSPHGYGILLSGNYCELLERRQRYPSKGSFGFRYWGEENTVSFSLVRNAVNPETRRDQYVELGVFEFDCIPVGSVLDCVVNWEYSENGLLHLRVMQPGGAYMPLYDVSRLDGHEIANPRRHEVHEENAPSLPQSFPTSRKSWSAAELQRAVHFGRRLVETAEAKLGQANGEQRERIVHLSEEIRQWVDDTAGDANHRTPHIRDLGRGLLSLLHVSRLIDKRELAELQEGL
jgi:molecular chaperone DnaK (HSP70)